MNFTAERWVGKKCLLNGKPARISGRFLKFGIVGQIDCPIALEYAWETIEKIMITGGQFKY